ncbi:MAG: excinuclease ABC subunit UvrC [Beijerinckiaceae bacterium]
MSRKPFPDQPVDDDLPEDEDQPIELNPTTEIEAAVPASIEAGAEVIKRFWKTLPNSPGVYRMLDKLGEVLYVGKAKKLKARVANYARGQGHSNRIARMISETVTMEFVVTETETEALLLETNYIKQFRPRFNVLMRDDKSFPYILITGDHAAPQIVKHRGARNRKGEYYGPFASAWAVKRTIDALQKAFLLRTCSDSYFDNRSRPCLLYQIKRCSGPCTGEIEPAAYTALVGEAKGFLSGKSKAVKEHMAREMQAASDELEFEKAARFRDRIAALSATGSSQDINAQTVEEADVFAVAEEAGQFCIEVFFFRTYQNWGNRAYFPKADRSLSKAEVLDAFLAQFYDDKPVPRLMLLSEDVENAVLLGEAFSLRAGRKVELQTPQRGEKKDLVAHALKNAVEELSRRMADAASQSRLMAALAEAFGLEKPPRRIEVYDNSHISGTNAVGAMVVAGIEGFRKQHYRTFNIKSTDITPGDDFGMMREVLERRFARLVKEGALTPSPRLRGEGGGEGPGEIALYPQAPHPAPLPASGDREDTFPNWPDLVLIDGGKGQLSAVRETLEKLGITNVPLVGVAKGADRDAGRETFVMEGRTPFRLPPRDPALYFVQRLRDEAHRFAIGTHRAKRKREMTKSPLDEIGGIGPTRKRALLLHFGTAKAIARASLDDLAGTPGVNAATAKAVYDFFNDKA